MVRTFKNFKKESPIILPDAFESKRENIGYNKLIYNKLNNIPINNSNTKKIKNNYSNVKYMREQLHSENESQKKFKIKRGQTGSNNMKRNNYSDINFKTKNKIKLNDFYLYNTGYNHNDVKSKIEEENKLKYLRNNDRFMNLKNKSYGYDINNNNINKNANNNSQIYYNMSLDEIEVKVGFLWNKLGVEDTFQKTFNKLKEDMESDEAKKEFMIMEIQNLEKFNKFLKELSSEIEKREKNLLFLKKLNKIIENQFIDLDLDINDKILKDFYQTLIEYRNNTIKVVEGFITYHQFFSYNINKGKFKEDYLIKKYELFGKENKTGNYLLKLKNDLNFLGKSKINGYKHLNLNFGVNSDPFLLNVMYKIPFNLENYCSRIKQCQYAIMQEVIFNTINPESDNIYKDNDSYDDEEGKIESGTNNNSNRLNKKEYIKYKYENLNKKRSNNYQRMREGNRKNEKIMIEAQLIDKNDYEKFFNTNIYNEEQSEEKILAEIRNEFNNAQGFKKINKKKYKIKTDENSHKINDEYKNEESKINQIEKKEKKDLGKNNDSKADKDKENIIDKKNNNENLEIIDKQKESDKMKENKDINENLINIIENKNENENKDGKQNENNANSNKDNNIEEHISINIKESKEKSRSASPKSERGSKIILTKDMNENVNENNNNITNDKNSIAIKSIRENDLIEFYNGKLSDFLPLYSSYYNLIPEEQKIIFNIKSDPMQYIYNNFFPKILIYKDKKAQNIKGLCIFSHIFTNESKNNDLFIEHISAYNEEDREQIFEKLLSFIKENSCNIFGSENNRKEKNIYIDLYYKCIDEKFSINANIRDFLRNQLKFKWVKLENSSKLIRYQKMRHQFIIGNGNKVDLLNNECDDNNVLNESILGRKEFNNEENNKSEEEKESEEDELNINISKILDNDIEKGRNKGNKESINSQDKSNTYNSKKYNLLNNFIIKNKTVLKFNKEYIDNNNKNNCSTNIKYSNPFNFIYLLNKINESENISYNDISTNISHFFSKKDSDIINNITSNCIFEKKTILLETDYYYSDIHELMKENKNKFKINTNINIYPIFDNCISFKYNNFYYNRVQQKKIKTFIDKDTQQKFYVINKTENQILLISSSLNDAFKEKYINKENKDNISINFMNIYNNLNDSDNIDNNILYIPAFEIKSKLVNNYFINNENKYNLYCFEDYYNVKYLTEELKINKNREKDNNKNVSTNFVFDMVKEEEINKQNFIGDDFLLVILNLNVTEDLRALPLLTLYITKDNFISD